MRIQTIEITNYKAFLDTHKIAVGGKNVFVSAGKEGKTAVKVTFKPDHQGQNKKSPMYSAPRPMIPAMPMIPASAMATNSKAFSPTSTCWPFTT